MIPRRRFFQLSLGSAGLAPGACPARAGLRSLIIMTSHPQDAISR
jgi:hypothetical protein